MGSQFASTPTLRGSIVAWGWVAGLGTAALAADLVWEQTVLTWTRGPQMVGFSLFHTFGILLVPFPLLLSLWLVVVAGVSVRDLLGHRAPGWRRFSALLGSVLLLVSLIVPYGVWQRVFARQLAAGAFATDFMTFNAAEGDAATMAALFAHGVPLDTREPNGETLLHIAARLGRVDVMAFLASHGADPNAEDRHGDTPLDEAISAKQDQAVQFLVRRFGNRLAPAKPRVEEPIHVTVRPEPSR
jgi:hypothetical protein